jgi:hypothetical protein
MFLNGLGHPMTIRHGNVTITQMDGLAGDDAPPSRLTWFVVGMAVMLFAKPLMGLGEGVLGLGHAGIGRARKRIER